MVRAEPRRFRRSNGESLRPGRGARRRGVVAVVRERPKTEADFRKALGRKISLRYALHGDPEHSVSEAVGYVQSVETALDSSRVLITIVNRRGETTVVPLSDIQITKLFPA